MTSTATIVQNVFQEAKEKSGVDSGVGILTEIVTGVVGTLLGGAAIGAAASGGGDGDDRKDRSLYKMHIYKDFGSGLPVGQKVYLYACIVKYTNGKGAPDDELTTKISVQDMPSAGFRALDEGFAAPYKRFGIVIAENSPAAERDTLTVPFVFRGKGGIMTENVKFRILPPATAELVLSDGKTVRSINQIDLILGDQRTYSSPTAAIRYLIPHVRICVRRSFLIHFHRSDLRQMPVICKTRLHSKWIPLYSAAICSSDHSTQERISESIAPPIKPCHNP